MFSICEEVFSEGIEVTGGENGEEWDKSWLFVEVIGEGLGTADGGLEVGEPAMLESELEVAGCSDRFGGFSEIFGEANGMCACWCKGIVDG